MTSTPSRLFTLMGWATTLSFLLLVGYALSLLLSNALAKEEQFQDQRLKPYLEAEAAFEHQRLQDSEREELEIQERIEAYKQSPSYKGDHCYE